MNRVAVISFISLLGLTPVWAGENHEKGSHDKMEHRSEKRLDHLKKKLNLTDEQQKKIQSIQESKREKKKAIHEQMKALHDETQAEIRAVLTPEQQAKFDEMKANRKEHKQQKKELKK